MILQAYFLSGLIYFFSNEILFRGSIANYLFKSSLCLVNRYLIQKIFWRSRIWTPWPRQSTKIEHIRFGLTFIQSTGRIKSEVKYPKAKKRQNMFKERSLKKGKCWVEGEAWRWRENHLNSCWNRLEFFYLATRCWLTGERLGNRPRREHTEQLGNKRTSRLLPSMATFELISCWGFWLEDKDLPIGDIDFVSSEDYESKQDSLSLFVLHIITTYITSDIFQKFNIIFQKRMSY